MRVIGEAIYSFQVAPPRLTLSGVAAPGPRETAYVEGDGAWHELLEPRRLSN